MSDEPEARDRGLLQAVLKDSSEEAPMEAVDVVLFTSFYHMGILHLKMFDVKSLD